MRLAPPPPDVCITPQHEHTALLRAVATALSALHRHERAFALAQAELGDIDLPPGAPNALNRAQLQAAAPLYFAAELENSGLLATAELVAGLFASGAITQPLGPAAQLLNAFWRARHDRLQAAERQAIFARVVEAPHFERLMGALCEAIVAQADGSDLREGVVLETTAMNLGEFLAQRVDAMATLAARDIVENINTALAFLRDRMIQAAFGASSLWTLVSLTLAAQGQSQGDAAIRNHVERGRAGQSVLLWLAAHYTDQAPRLNPAEPADVELIGAAQRWLSASPLTTTATSRRAAAPSLPIAA